MKIPVGQQVGFENNIQEEPVNTGEMPHYLWITALITVTSIITSSNKGICFIKGTVDVGSDLCLKGVYRSSLESTAL